MMTEARFDKNVENIRMSPIVSISEEARRKGPEFHARTGKKILLFQRGEIDLPTPEYIRNAAKKAMDEGHTKYPKSGGEDFFKEGVIKKLEYFNKATGIGKENIAATYGGQEGLELTFKLFQGKKAGGFAPCWSCVLENFIPYAGTNFSELPLNEDFSINFDDLKKLVKNISFLYLNTPQNPTGKLFTKDEVLEVVKLCRQNGVYLISDEAYEAITFEGKEHFSPISLDFDNIISVFTMSKTYAMTGWRVGYLVSRNKRIVELIKMGNYTQTAGVATFLQYAAGEALANKEESDKHIKLMVGDFQKRRDQLMEGFRSIPGVKVEKPDGAFYLFPNFTELIPKGLKGEERNHFIYNLLMQNGIAAVHGSCFGHYFTDNMRFSFSTTPPEVISEGIERMRQIFTQD
ncbi:MAG: pyridoxal phosphate-dependent aminotransferase [Ignavibacteria bacterium]|jgi:aspartate aminotransferase|nr:pyridoxal phosphate-dependent aminotransferase [Ignavibacteria bacterium]MCU7518720.1 pyridoxal phosphate-dependent aminotransferase [Ignavibacteria bacterium]